MSAIHPLRWLCLPILSVFGAVAGACGAPAGGPCSFDVDCTHAGVVGVCIEGQCAFPSDGCESGWTYLDVGSCVPSPEDPGDGGGAGEGEGDAGADGSGEEDVPITCGDGVLDPDEECDDGDALSGDGCESNCTRTDIIDLVAGPNETCVIFEGGQGRCFGRNDHGVLGYGPEVDDEVLAPIPDVPSQLWSSLAQPVFGGGYEPEPGHDEDPALGSFACFLLEQSLRCVGENARGQLASGNKVSMDDVQGTQFAPLVAQEIDQVALGSKHGCAVRLGHSVSCWGANDGKQLGFEWDGFFGDSPGEELDDQWVSLAGGPRQVAVGGYHSCAVLEPGDRVQCWGDNSRAQLGSGADTDSAYGHEAQVLDFHGRAIEQLDSGHHHNCVRFDDGGIRCWGGSISWPIQGFEGAYQTAPAQGFDVTTPKDLEGFIDLASGGYHVCARGDDRQVYCWGRGNHGATGLGHQQVQVEPHWVDTGGQVKLLAAGQNHTCVVRDDNTVLCWGYNGYGQLGTGNTQGLGHTPSTVPGTLDPIEFE